jgi:two-component system, cell cycle sensor histidine kinase and response regulator CckA
MPSALRVLLVEDQESDAALLLRELDRIGYEVTCRRVDTLEAMAAALAEPCDLVISDYSLPGFSAHDALALCRDRGADVPFIIVSGTIEEEEAVESLRQGAQDFVTKGRLARLGPAIARSLREHEERRARRAAEARLQRAEKLEAIGQLAGGVAHDFNNLLGVIQGCGELMTRDLAGDARQKRRLDQILRAASQGASLTRRLLALSRQQALEARPMDVNAVVSDMEGMLRRLISEDIQITTVLTSGLHRVKADRAQIEQVLMNLAVNARDAMSGGGRLIIETANVELDDSYVASHPDARPGHHAMLAVSDTGHGMDSGTLSHVFEPFFTTKEPGRGTGLGLATVYGIVRQSGGHLAVYSEPGRGATFKVYLPRTDEADAPTTDQPALEPPRRGSETVLLVEDEATLRTVIREQLEEGGYTVIDGPSPEEALSAAACHPGPIHLMVTDLVMPRFNGREAATRVSTARPGIKVLYMSGYASTAAGLLGPLPSPHWFLQKPFSLDTLFRKVREVLDSPR